MGVEYFSGPWWKWFCLKRPLVEKRPAQDGDSRIGHIGQESETIWNQFLDDWLTRMEGAVLKPNPRNRMGFVETSDFIHALAVCHPFNGHSARTMVCSKNLVQSLWSTTPSVLWSWWRFIAFRAPAASPSHSTTIWARGTSWRITLLREQRSRRWVGTQIQICIWIWRSSAGALKSAIWVHFHHHFHDG